MATRIGLTATPRGAFVASGGPPPFPTQYPGLRVATPGGVVELCLVAEGDAVGGLRIDKNGTTYGVYLVDTSDGNASPFRIETPAGTKAIRLKT